MKVAFIHPDLGIGGAERLVVDAALALQKKGHEVTIFTSHHDPTHAFEETSNGTLKVEVLGDWLFPRNIAGKLSILCATLRQFHLTQSLIANYYFDVFVVDQLPAAVPYLRVFYPDARVLFYCHHPDLVLTTRSSIIKKLYRLPFDHFERWCTAKSDQIAVNSSYTRKVFFETFGRKGMPDPTVVYPVVDASSPIAKAEIPEEIHAKLSPFCSADKGFLLSINRFERKKDIDLALASFSLLLHAQTESRKHLLVIAGGYDLRVKENKEYLEELKKLATKFRIPYDVVFPDNPWKKVDLEKSRVLFLPSVSASLKAFLLQNAAALLYTPTDEHFGIVPLEAMSVETPVLATNTGGPLETIVDGVTGWLREPDMEAWYHVIKLVLMDAEPAELEQMGKAGRKRVTEEFSAHNMELAMNNLVQKTMDTPRKFEDRESFNTKLVTSMILVSVAMLAMLIQGLFKFLMGLYPTVKETIRAMI